MGQPIWEARTEPKRKFKFVLNLGEIPAYTVKTTDRPTITVGEAKHEFMVHDFYFPGRVSWNEISVTLIDPIDENTSKKLLDFIKSGGYVMPNDFNENVGNPNYLRKTLTKLAFQDAMHGDVSIDTLNSEGKVVETWALKNSWIKSVNYNAMGYAEEGLVELTVGLRYDWAVLTSYT